MLEGMISVAKIRTYDEMLKTYDNALIFCQDSGIQRKYARDQVDVNALDSFPNYQPTY